MIDKVDMFFTLLSALYGKEKYQRAFGDAMDLQIAKKFWAEEINKYTEEQLTETFDKARKQLQAGEMFSGGVSVSDVLQNAPRSAHKSYELFLPPPNETLEQKSLRREKASSEIGKLKNLFA